MITDCQICYRKKTSIIILLGQWHRSATWRQSKSYYSEMFWGPRYIQLKGYLSTKAHQTKVTVLKMYKHPLVVTQRGPSCPFISERNQGQRLRQLHALFAPPSFFLPSVNCTAHAADPHRHPFNWMHSYFVQCIHYMWIVTHNAFMFTYFILGREWFVSTETFLQQLQQ